MTGVLQSGQVVDMEGVQSQYYYGFQQVQIRVLETVMKLNFLPLDQHQAELRRIQDIFECLKASKNTEAQINVKRLCLASVTLEERVIIEQLGRQVREIEDFRLNTRMLTFLVKEESLF